MQKLRRLFAALSGFCLMVVFAVTLGQVVQRYIFNLPMPWATDIIRIFFAYSVFFGMAVGVFNRAHLNIDVLVRLFPAPLKPCFELLSNVVVFVFLGAVFLFSIPFVKANADQVTPYLQLSMSWLYAVIPVTVGFMLLFLFGDTLRLLRSFFVPSPGSEGR
ncbi:MAG: TRAP transporter small permease [Fretibacterium sp.]|uniref:TRAP transporter small permease n=1 Tax=Fretibacterium sp. OH1220_COT-178 TaxID=2491047 RepID=UPI000F5D954A|nr:TRAP transporter small permease [Fretibacterium sp. OH1220_COT-178]MDO4787001.1 TRAP transporter small permease [Fretibacterium sp.]RRD63888.1 TRAP transporter small permease [Fretibacterium sp. OH1220_COT-178]